MPRRSLKPQLNQIRAWVQQGRTDAWIAHQLEVSASELREFRKQHDLNADSGDANGGEVDLRDEIEAEVEAATAEEAAEEAEDEEEPEEDEGDVEKPARKAREAEDDGDEEEGDSRPRPRRRRRGRRGGRGRRKELEATFDPGKSEVTVRIEADQIVIRRAGESGSSSGSGSDADSDD